MYDKCLICAASNIDYNKNYHSHLQMKGISLEALILLPMYYYLLV